MKTWLKIGLICVGIILAIIILFIIINPSFSFYKSEGDKVTRTSYTSEENKFRQINFDEKFDDKFLDSVGVGTNVVLGDKLHISKSHEFYQFWYWANGPQDKPLGEGSDFIKIEINDYVSNDLAKGAFNDVYRRIIKNPKNLLTEPTIVKEYSDIKGYEALYDIHQEQSTFFEGEYKVAYAFVENNFYIAISSTYSSSPNKEQKNKLTVDIGEKVRDLLK